MDASRFIAGRLRFKGRMAMVCIAVSFFVMIIAVSVSSGFRWEIRNGLSEISGDVLIAPVNMNYFDEASPIGRNPSYLADISAMEGVASVRPVVWRAGIVKSGENIHGVLFKGVEKDSSAAPLEVSVPERLAEMLSLEVGGEMLVYFVGENVRLRKFRIAEVSGVALSGDDRLIVYTGISDLQRLNGWDSSQVSAFEVQLEDRYRSTSAMDMMAAEIGYAAYSDTAEDGQRVVAESSVSRYPQLYDWLDLIDFNVVFILALMTIVAGFNMISGLLIMLFEHISTIGTLKTMGMRDRSIAMVFLRSASSNVIRGMLAGNIAALLFCVVQGAFHLIPLDPDNYFISFVPVHIDWLLFLAADAVSYVVIMLMLLLPSLFISRVDPAKTVAVR